MLYEVAVWRLERQDCYCKIVCFILNILGFGVIGVLSVVQTKQKNVCMHELAVSSRSFRLILWLYLPGSHQFLFISLHFHSQLGETWNLHKDAMKTVHLSDPWNKKNGLVLSASAVLFSIIRFSFFKFLLILVTKMQDNCLKLQTNV